MEQYIQLNWVSVMLKSISTIWRMKDTCLPSGLVRSNTNATCKEVNTKKASQEILRSFANVGDEGLEPPTPSV